MSVRIISQLKKTWLQDPQSVSHSERLISAAGSFFSILTIIIVSHLFLSGEAAVYIISSMGASAVLLFAVPHGTLSQPWPLVGGHLLSGFIGVACSQSISSPELAGSIAVGLSVGAMYYLRCIHPPGGATALMPVIGGAQIHELGYQFLITPLLLNVLSILVVAIAFNAFFHWRRYPVFLSKPRHKLIVEPSTPESESPTISHEDLACALSEIDSFIDVAESDLVRIYDIATRKHLEKNMHSEALQLNKCYSNGAYGNEWSVRKIIAINNNGREQELTYRVVAGKGRNQKQSVSIEQFARWARYEVYRDEDNWRKVQ